MIKAKKSLGQNFLVDQNIIKKIIDIKPNSFSPSPKIDSSLLFFSPKKDYLSLINPLNLEKIIRILNSVANDEFQPTLIASIALDFNLTK